MVNYTVVREPNEYYAHESTDKYTIPRITSDKAREPQGTYLLEIRRLAWLPYPRLVGWFASKVCRAACREMYGKTVRQVAGTHSLSSFSPYLPVLKRLVVNAIFVAMIDISQLACRTAQEGGND